MWDSLPDWVQILKAAIIGAEFGLSVMVGWYLMRLRTSKTIEHLREILRQKNGM
jgi:hypothetical protein